MQCVATFTAVNMPCRVRPQILNYGTQAILKGDSITPGKQLLVQTK
jgi:hypothetical protein